MKKIETQQKMVKRRKIERKMANEWLAQRFGGLAGGLVRADALTSLFLGLGWDCQSGFKKLKFEFDLVNIHFEFWFNFV